MPDVRIPNKKYKNCRDVINTFNNEKLVTMQSGKFSYSNIGYMILGYLLEMISQKQTSHEDNWYEVLNKYIFIPLEMKDTNPYLGSIVPYEKSKPLNENDELEIYFASSAGGLYSSVDDFMKFLRGYKNILNNKVDEFQKLYFFENGSFEHFGYIPGGTSFIKCEIGKSYQLFLSNSFQIFSEKKIISFFDKK